MSYQYPVHFLRLTLDVRDSKWVTNIGINLVCLFETTDCKVGKLPPFNIINVNVA